MVTVDLSPGGEAGVKIRGGGTDRDNLDRPGSAGAAGPRPASPVRGPTRHRNGTPGRWRGRRNRFARCRGFERGRQAPGRGDPPERPGPAVPSAWLCQPEKPAAVVGTDAFPPSHAPSPEGPSGGTRRSRKSCKMIVAARESTRPEARTARRFFGGMVDSASKLVRRSSTRCTGSLKVSLDSSAERLDLGRLRTARAVHVERKPQHDIRHPSVPQNGGRDLPTGLPGPRS